MNENEAERADLEASYWRLGGVREQFDFLEDAMRRDMAWEPGSAACLARLREAVDSALGRIARRLFELEREAGE